MDWKKLGKKILFPNVLIILILTVISAVALVYVFLNHLELTIAGYLTYTISFYSLLVLTIYLCLVLPKQYQRIRQKIYDNPWGNRYMTDAAFRTRVSLHLSLGINMLYTGLNVFFYFLDYSYWFLVLAVYYTILAVMRFLLVRYAHKNGIGKNRESELRRARACSVILLNLNFVLTGAILMILYQNKGFEYQGILIYAMAAYTFYATISAVVNLFKYRKYKSPVMTTAKIITLSSALVSMLSLETAMFSQFGQDMSPQGQRLMIILTGAGISIVVITISACMIIRTSEELKQLKEERLEKEQSEIAAEEHVEEK